MRFVCDDMLIKEGFACMYIVLTAVDLGFPSLLEALIAYRGLRIVYISVHVVMMFVKSLAT